MFLSKFTAEASIGNRDGYVYADSKYIDRDNSIKITPSVAKDPFFLCGPTDCSPIRREGKKVRACFSETCEYWDHNHDYAGSIKKWKFRFIPGWE